MTTITTAPPSSSSSLRDAHNQLVDSGWKEIGCGCYATIYMHPDCPDTVLKVGGHLRDAWLDYAKSCTKTRSKHAPRINAIEFHEDFYFAEVELLEPLPFKRFQEESLSRAGLYPNEVPTPSLRAFMRRTERVRRKFTDHGRDYHNGNFMVRPGTGEIVCTDPWS